MKVLADSLVGQQGVPEELYQEFMGDITAEIDRENKIITDLLSLVKMDKKAADLNITHMDINQLLDAYGSQCHLFPFHVYHAAQCSFFPFLQIANHAEPAAFFRLLEGQYIIVRLYRLQTEYFNQSSRFLAKVQACLNHLCIVEYHH